MPTRTVKEVAAALELHLPGWNADPGEGVFAHLTHADIPHAKIVLRGQHGGRITLSGVYPYGFGPRDEPRITVDATRDPARIAADVRRRLIEPYLPLLQQALEQEAVYKADAARKQVQREQLAEVLDAEIKTYGSDPHIYWRGPASAYGQLKVQGEVYLDLRALPFDLALAICQTIQAYQEAHR